jgi:hypothetical protein
MTGARGQGKVMRDDEGLGTSSKSEQKVDDVFRSIQIPSK